MSAMEQVEIRPEKAINGEPVKIIRIIARLNIGGPAVHTILLTSRLPGERYDSTLVKGAEGPREGNMLALADEEGVEPIEIPELGREIRLTDDLAAFVSLVKLMWRMRPAVVHTHTAKAGTLGRLAALVVNSGWALRRLVGRPAPRPIKTVHTFHGHVFKGYFSPIKSKLFLAVEKFLALSTDAVVVISPSQRTDVVDNYKIAGDERVRTIPLGLELAPFLGCRSHRGKLRTELGIGEDVRLIGIVGRLVPIKRHDLLLKALSMLKDSPVPEASGFCCVVVGDGELRPVLEERARDMGLSERVRFLGWRRDLATIYADLDCLVLTSDNEGTPVSIIEALASEVPVIATAVGGVPDLMRASPEESPIKPVYLSNGKQLEHWDGEGVVGRMSGPRLASSGILVPPGDCEALKLALELLWSKPDLLVEIGRRGSSSVHESFSIERLVEDVDLLYTELLGEGFVRRGGNAKGEEVP